MVQISNTIDDRLNHVVILFLQSASTKKIINKDSGVPDSPESYRRLNDTNTSFHSKGEEQFLDYEEESIESSRKSLSRAMANMQTNIQATLESASISSAVTDVQKEHSHSADESSESDDSVDESTLCPTVVAKDRQPQLAVPVEKPIDRSSSDSDDDDNETYAESTICPTVIARRSETGVPDFENDENAPEREKDILSPQPPAGYQQIFRNRHDISQVLVQEGETSILTMDATMFFQDNDAVSQQSSKIYNDAASLGEETPVLDRYRIIPDDSSTGFKVMPNERGSSRKSKLRMVANESSIPNSVRFHDRQDGGASLLGELTEYRKTPFRKGRATDSIDDDQHAPNEENSARFHLPARDSHATALAVAKSPRLKFASSPQIGEPGSAFRRSPCRRDESSSVGFLSPNVSTRTRLFRKTPLPKNSENTDFSSVRFDTELSTPGKHSAATYQQTPYKRTNDSSNLSSVQFDPDTKFEGSAFSAGERKTHRSTPYKSGMAPSPESHPKGVHFEDEITPRGVKSSSANKPLTSTVTSTFAKREKKTCRSTPYKTSSRVMAPSPEVESAPSDGEEPIVNKVTPKWQVQSENLAHNSSDRILTHQTSDTNRVPFRSPLTAISPVRKTMTSTPQNVRFMNNELLRSPESIASTLTGLTTLREMEKELFPVRASGKPRKSDFSMTQKSSIPKISASEYSDADEQMKLLSLEALNQIVDALNGRIFLEKASGNVTERFTSDEAHKILKKSGVEKSVVGTFRKREKVLKALIYWNRLEGNRIEDENNPSGGGAEYFEIVAGH